MTSSGTVFPPILMCDRPGVDHGKKFFVAILEAEHDAQALHAAAGGTGRRTHKHAQEDDDLRHGRPHFIISRRVTGGGHDGDHLEGGEAQRLSGIRVDRAINIEPDHEGQDQAHGQVKPAFRIFPEGQRPAFQQLVVQGEIDAGQQHEHGNDHIDVDTVEVGHRGVFR
jgi:hypothetical protein